MSTVDIMVPALPESVSDATVATWHKQAGESVKAGEPLVDLETDKVMLEIPAPIDGVLAQLSKPEGETVISDEVLGTLDASAQARPQTTAQTETATVQPAPPSTPAPQPASTTQPSMQSTSPSGMMASPSVRRYAAEQGVDVHQVQSGRLAKQDIAAAMQATPADQAAPERLEKRVPMTRLRARVAERLLNVQRNAALLTTFNEVNMQPVMAMRARYKEKFEKKHGARLGFMSFFVKAAVAALKAFPVVNASVDGQDIVYHGYFDIGIAVSSPRGLVVPVLRHADTLSMAEIEKAIADYAVRAREGKLALEEIQGGTFTLTNGGIFGSMLSTPIINPPQSGILGMHNIVKRPVVEADNIVIRPVMYLALSYDHRLVDGSDSVRFLVTIKQLLEDPSRLLLDV